MTIISSNLNWGKDNWKGILESDAKGYYAYLPAVFIYQDLNFSFLEEVQKKYPAPHLDYDYRSGVKGISINKYYAGTAMLQLPFFTLAHWVTIFSGGEADGYSKWYLISVNVAALFYLFLGLYYLRKTLKLFNLADCWIALLILASAFGSNLFIYSVVEPGMSHVFSFACISLWVYLLTQFVKQSKLSLLYYLALLLGLIVLIRPVNGLVILAVPFVVGSWEACRSILNPLLQKPHRFFFVLVLFAVFPFAQLIYYKLSTDSWWVYAYLDEGFNFLDPHLIDILFSYKKGLFLYTPIYLLAFMGLLPLWEKDRFRFWSWLGFFGLITYVFASWWMWYYGGSFSSRVYVEYLPFFMLLFSFAFKLIKKRQFRFILAALTFLIVVLCQIQSYQYRYYIIHYSEMTKELYWNNFLKLKP